MLRSSSGVNFQLSMTNMDVLARLSLSILQDVSEHLKSGLIESRYGVRIGMATGNE